MAWMISMLNYGLAKLKLTFIKLLLLSPDEDSRRECMNMQQRSRLCGGRPNATILDTWISRFRKPGQVKVEQLEYNTAVQTDHKPQQREQPMRKIRRKENLAASRMLTWTLKQKLAEKG